MAPHVDIETESTLKTVYEQLVDIFEASTIEADLTGLIDTVCDIYNSSTSQGFEESFEHILKLTLSTNKRSTDVRRVFWFISELVVNLDNKYKDANAKESMEDIDDIMHPLLKYLFSILEQWSQASCYTVRFRSCQLLHMILTYIQDHGIGELDMHTYETISKIIESRKLDVSCNVRLHAVLLAKFFQDPSSINDPVIAGLCWQMQYDPNPRVRQITVSIVAACEETIIPIAKRFLYDKNANVRNAALLHICNRISPRSFTTSQRILILKQCFSDPSALVRRNAEQRLIPVWFRAYKDKLCRFFKDLREGNESLDNFVFIPELLQVLSKCVKIAQVMDEIGLDVDTCLPKSTLTGEKAFLWRHFYQLAQRDERLSRFIPQPEVLIDFILRYFSDSFVEDDQVYIFNELIVFLVDIIEANGIGKCEKIFPALLGIMKNPFISHETVPYIVPLYLNFAPMEKDVVQNDMFQVIEDLLKILQFTPVGQEKSIVLKCFAIASQVLIEENYITSNFRNIKDILINHYLSSEDLDLKIQAIVTLSLYCQTDLKETKLSWPLFADAVKIGVSPLRNALLKGAFDILKCYGLEIFSDLTTSGEDLFNEALGNLLLHQEDDDKERSIMVQGILKLYLAHHTVSPIILAQVVVLLFHPDEYHSLRRDLEEFFQMFGETKEEAECLNKAFLATLNILFGADKNSPFHKVSIKKVSLQLIEYSNGLEKSKGFTLEDNFKDLLVIKLTKKFLKMPWRLSASDLYSVCSAFIPKSFDKLLKLKDHVKLIIESLQSAVFQQKNPYSKRSIKQFSSYLKKIQVALDTAPLIEAPKRATGAPSPLEKRLFTNSYTDSDSPKSSKETEISSTSSPHQGEISSPRTEVLSENNSVASSLCESSLPGTEALEAGTSLPAKTPSKENIQLSTKTPAKGKTPLPTKTPSKGKMPLKETVSLPAKTPAKEKTPLPFKSASKAMTPNLPTKTPSRVKTPLPVKTLSKKKTDID